MIGRRVLFRCDAGAIPELGTGHLVRGLLVANELRKRGCEISFCGQLDEPALARLKEAGFPVIPSVEKESEAELLVRAVGEFRADVLIRDRLNSTVAAMGAVRDQVPIIIAFDDQGDGASLADITINALVGGDGLYDTYDYVVVPPSAAPLPRSPDRPRILISFGGYDHNQIGGEVAPALADVDADITWLVRSSQASAATPDRIKLAVDTDFGEAIRGSDIAVLNGGLSLFEALANGTPSIAVAQYPHQSRTIERLAARGAVIDAGPISPEIGQRVRTILLDLIDSPQSRDRLRRNAMAAVDGLGLQRVGELTMVVERLPWDCAFFGVEIASIYTHRLTKRILAFALEECRKNSIECIYYLGDSHDSESVRLAESAGFHFVDIRLSLEQILPARSAASDRHVREATRDDLPAIQLIARDAYPMSRYYFDHNFPLETCRRFYSDWLAKCVQGELADTVFLIEDEDGPLGYIAVTHESAVTANILFVGVHERAKGSGIGARLVNHALNWAAQRGFQRMEVVTQGRNYQAQRLYQRCGFVTEKAELWYHRWNKNPDE